MQVFITWSGSASKQAALSIHKWFSVIIQKISPFISSVDIRKGQRWASEIAEKLSSTKYGIVCLTPDNLNAPWIHFEAGALSKASGSMVWTLLLGDLTEGDVQGPLAQFQHTPFRKDEVFKLLDTINTALGEDALSDSVLRTAFNSHWGELEKEVNNALQDSAQKPMSEEPLSEERKILDEILHLARLNARQSSGEKELSSIDASLRSHFNHVYGQDHKSWIESRSSLELLKQLIEDYHLNHKGMAQEIDAFNYRLRELEKELESAKAKLKD